MSAATRLLAIKLLHTAVWAVFASAVLAIPVAAWCGAHGLAEMAGFRQFDHLKEELGGERPFLEAVLNHMGLFPKAHDGC